MIMRIRFSYTFPTHPEAGVRVCHAMRFSFKHRYKEVTEQNEGARTPSPGTQGLRPLGFLVPPAGAGAAAGLPHLLWP